MDQFMPKPVNYFIHFCNGCEKVGAIHSQHRVSKQNNLFFQTNGKKVYRTRLLFVPNFSKLSACQLNFLRQTERGG